MISMRKNEPAAPAASSAPVSAPLPRTRPASSSPTVIGADLSIVGNLVSSGEIQIEGSIQGDIQGVNILIRESAKITGTISGHDVIVHGVVMGSIKADRIVLAATSKMEGDVFHQTLNIEQGAFFEGKSRRGLPEASSTAAGQGLQSGILDSMALK